MAISEQNIQFLASEIMADVDEGGGNAIGTAIVDGVINNAFPDISDLDRTIGRFSLRKLWLAVRTPSVDTFYGAKVALLTVPADPATGYVLLASPTETAKRSAIAPMTGGTQYATWLRAHGAKPLTAPAASGAMAVTVESASQLIAPLIAWTDTVGGAAVTAAAVTSATVSGTAMVVTVDGSVLSSSAGVVDLLSDGIRINGGATTPLEWSAATITNATSIIGQGATTPSIVSGTVTATRATVTSGGATIIVTHSNTYESTHPTVSTATISNGVLGDFTLPAELAQQNATLVTDTMQQTGVTLTLNRTPVKEGSITITYRSGGVSGAVYTLTDNGAGGLTGDGTGSVNYTTGAVSFTGSHTPDIGTRAIASYLKAVYSNALIGTVYSVAPAVTICTDIRRGTLALNYHHNGTTVALIDDSNGVVKTAAGTVYGAVNYDSGVVSIYGAQRNAAGGVADSIEAGNWAQKLTIHTVTSFPSRNTDGTVTLSAGLTALLTKTVKVSWSVEGVSYTAIDDGAGAMRIGTVSVGTVTYSNGSIQISPDVGGVYTGGGFTIASANGSSVYSSISSQQFQITVPVPATVAGSLRFTLLGRTYSSASVTDWDDMGQTAAVPATITAAITQSAAPAISTSFRRVPLTVGGVALTSASGGGDTVQSTGEITVSTTDPITAYYSYTTSETAPTVTTHPITATGHAPYTTEAKTTYAPATDCGVQCLLFPPDGKLPVIAAGDVVVISHSETLTATPTNSGAGYVVNCGRTGIAWVHIVDAGGARITSGYTLDRAAGTVTFTTLSGLALPLTIRHTVADQRYTAEVNGGEIVLTRGLSRDFPAGALISSCLIAGDRYARVSLVFDQATWDGVTYSDTRVGSEATATLDTIAHPITVTNEGAETEKWALRWTTSTNVEVIGQTRGLVYSGAFAANIAPINPRTRNTDGSGGVPYFTIPLLANGGGWSAGNVVRFNTIGAIAPFWVARTIQPSDAPAGITVDGCSIFALGNINQQ